MNKADRKAKAEQSLSNEWAILKAIEQDAQVMKYIKHFRPAMLTKVFCLLAYKADLAGQTETLTYIPPEYWTDFTLCLRMMTESPAGLRYTPIPTRNTFRRVCKCEWLKFEDEW